MCGWVAFWERGNRHNGDLYARVMRMANTMEHRGPDDSGAWTDSECGLAMGFRRLSIVDLSPLGHQPMLSASGRFVIVFNGEVYNFATLKEQLEALGHRFRGHSDTEVMLAAIEQWGLDAAVTRFVGMFSFALWDNQEHRLFLVRDRLGIKPLYYGWMGETFLCGSELKALRAHPDFHPDVDRDTLTLYMRHNYVPAPYSIYKGVHQLEPGCILTIADGTVPSESPRRYWSAREVAERGAREPFTGSANEAIDALDGLLREAVGLRMVADVPLGAFLSGGIDSSTVVALMQAQSDRPVRTFSIGFSETGYNEAPYARAVAGHLGTDHTELHLTPEQAQAVVPMLPTMYDEPFGDPSQIPTFLVSRLARSQVTVSLSGDGGDELFCGYNRYFLSDNLWRKLRRLPRTPRKYLGKGIVAMSAPRYERWMRWLSPATERFGKMSATGHRLQRLGEVLSARSPEDLYLGIVSHWSAPEQLVLGGHEGPTALTSPGRWARLPDFTRRMMYLDMVTYLPGDILTKVDRASMAMSLEARVPLLDHRVVEFAWQLPLALKVRDGQGKWILRQVLSRYVPRELIERPKMGFGIPIDSWLRGPLREWAETLLDERRLRNEGYLDPVSVRSLWHAHLSGQRNWQYRLWNILMFEAWLEHWMLGGQDENAFVPAAHDAEGIIPVA